MAKIFFPYIDRPKEFPFLVDWQIHFPYPLDRQIWFPFIVGDWAYYWTLTTEGVTLYLGTEDIPANMPVLKDILLEDTGIAFYLENGSLEAQTSLSKMVYVEFEQIGKGVHTLSRLDPLTLGDIDPYTLGDISNVSANWKALRNAVVAAARDIAAQGGDVEMRLGSDTVVETGKAVFTGMLSSFIHTTGLARQRTMTLGELDPHVLEDIDMMLTTFRVFEDVPASIVKFIGVAHREALKNALAQNAASLSILANAIPADVCLGADAPGVLADIETSAEESVSRLEQGSTACGSGIAVNAFSSGLRLESDAPGVAVGIEASAEATVIEVRGACAGGEVGVIVLPNEHKTELLSSGIAIEIATADETT